MTFASLLDLLVYSRVAILNKIVLETTLVQRKQTGSDAHGSHIRSHWGLGHSQLSHSHPSFQLAGVDPWPGTSIL